MEYVATLIKYPSDDNVKNDFLLVGPFVPMRTNWLQTKFLVLKFGKQSLNINLPCNNCLSDPFISFADIQTCNLSFTKKSSERTQSYWLPKFKSECSRKRKIFFLLFAGNG